MRVVAPDGKVFETSVAIAQGGETSLQVQIKEAQLWWPNGYGAQPLYQVEISLVGQDIKQLDERNYQIGLRTIELRQQPDQWGRSFVFVVNNVAIMSKGSNWIPADSFPTRISDEYLEGLIRSAVETHQNMLRVWGGGFYEEERFYDLCDRYGILVWQEFIFACSIYPLDTQEFLDNVKVEELSMFAVCAIAPALRCGAATMKWNGAGWIGIGRTLSCRV